ncbi:MAG: hypothetical protein CSA62_01280 [Planctomycetota bacterium]|nr:MAG: hypothetical protein CSA62_01280 [Planctomycetota bacterium]
MRHRTIALALALLSGISYAQHSRVLPLGHGFDKKTGFHPYVSLFSKKAIHNLQLFSSAAVGLKTGAINEVAWRRAGMGPAWLQATRSVEMRIGYSNHEPGSMPARFSEIPSSPLTLGFKGTVSLPSSPPASGLPKFQIKIKLNKPFVFISKKGKLVIDMKVNAVLASDWFVDCLLARSSWVSGSSSSIGKSCTGTGKKTPQLILDSPHLLAPGREARIVLVDAPDKSKGAAAEQIAFNFLGISDKSWGSMKLPYAFPTGCTLYTGMDLSQAVKLEAPVNNARSASFYWKLPADPRLNGKEIFTQALVADYGANSMGLLLTHALKLKIGAASSTPYSTQTIYTKADATSNNAFQSAWQFAPVVRISGYAFQ